MAAGRKDIMGDLSDYMEGNYDGTDIEKVAQAATDVGKAMKAQSDIRMSQEASFETEADRISWEYKAVGEEFDELLNEYNRKNKFQEYLVSGAHLKCTQTTLENFPLSNGEEIILDTSGDEEGMDREQIVLNVTENGMDTNGLAFATVMDTVKGKNIPFFECNCLMAANRNEEEKRIKADKDCTKHGVCRHLMNLNEEWDNLPLKNGEEYMQNNAGYEEKDDVYLKEDDKAAGVGKVLNAQYATRQAACITMTSVLFCKHGGGLIYPMDSGQVMTLESAQLSLEDALALMTEYLRGNLSEEELNFIIMQVADTCGLTVADMVKGQFSAPEDVLARSRSFDDQIIAWTYYWNNKIQNEFSYKFTIDPNIVKAIIAQETSFGQILPGYEGYNPSRNVMQSLAAGNSTVWVAAGINPYDNNMFRVGDSISYKMLDGTIKTNGILAEDYLPQYDESDLNKEREKWHFKDFDIIKSIFETDSNGKYMIVFDNVTTNMSIAVGVGTLAGKIEAQKSIYEGVKDYNGKNGYVEHINGHLADMGLNGL